MVAEWKKKEVEELKSLVSKYPVFGIVDLHEVPSKQVQQIRKSIKDKAEIRMSRRNLILKALGSLERKNLEEIEKEVKRKEIKMPALICSDLGPFKLSKILKENRKKAEAKPGMTAEKDIEVEPGATPFKPGPVLSKFSKLGIETDVESGKVMIKEKSVVANKGEKVGKEAANLLNKLGIKPREVGLSLKAAWEDGKVYKEEELKVEPEKWTEKLKGARREALNLAANLEIFNQTSIRMLIRKASIQAKALKAITCKKAEGG